MEEIKYSKKIVIKNKILNEDDILRIARLIHEQCQPDDYQEEYDILFDDQSSINTTKDITAFKTDEFHRRRSKRIWFTYRSKGFKNKIDIHLYNSLLLENDSTVEISSTDKDWYNSIINEISTIISEIENQKINITVGTKYIGAMVISIFESLIFSNAVEKIFHDIFTNSQFTAIVTFCSMILMLINLYLIGLIEKAYPNVEFSFGPSYLNKSQKIRNSLGIFIPFLIDLIFFGLGSINLGGII